MKKPKPAVVMTTENTITNNCPPEIIESVKSLPKVVKIPRSRK